MKKLFILSLFLLFISGTANSQNNKFAWVTNPLVGSNESDTSLINIVQDINLYSDINFVIISGNLTAHGYNTEITKLSAILNKLKLPYYTLPGENDLRWSRNAGIDIQLLHDGGKFFFNRNNTQFIGLKDVNLWQGGNGHFSPEEISWLSDSLRNFVPNSDVFVFSYFPFGLKTDNWYKITNLLTNQNFSVLFAASEKSKTVTNKNGLTTITGMPVVEDKTWNYNVVENKNDSLVIENVKNGIRSPWIKIKKNPAVFPKIDSLQFVDLARTEQAGFTLPNYKLLWQKDINKSTTSNILVSEKNIFAATDNGNVICYDSSGNELWIYESGDKIVGRPVREGNFLAVATVQGDLISLDIKTGEVLQVIGIGDNLVSPLSKVKVEYNGEETTGIIAGSSTGKIYCYDIHTFELIWENDSPHGVLLSGPLIFNHRIFWGSQDGFIYSIDDRTGSLYWKWQAGNDFYTAPSMSPIVSDGQNIYTVTPDKFVSKIDMLLGITRWRKDYGAWSSIAISNDKNTLIVKSISNDVYFISVSNGKNIRGIKTDFGFDLSSNNPVEWNNNYLFGTENGTVYLIDEKYRWKKLFFMGNSTLHSIQKMSDNVFVISNYDGRIIAFELQ